MSLIDQALRKAEQHVAQQDEDRRADLTQMSAQPATSRSAAGPMIAIVLVATAVVGAAVWGVLHLREGQRQAAQATHTPTSDVVVAQASQTATSKAPDTQVSPQPVGFGTCPTVEDDAAEVERPSEQPQTTSTRAEAAVVAEAPTVIQTVAAVEPDKVIEPTQPTEAAATPLATSPKPAVASGPPPQHQCVQRLEREGEATIELQCVLWSSQTKLAIVNGRTVRAGSLIGQMRVTSIERDGVKLEQAGQRYYLLMP